jgi:hypothetical protein
LADGVDQHELALVGGDVSGHSRYLSIFGEC